MHIVLRHGGPGIHPIGSPQSKHNPHKGSSSERPPRSILDQSEEVKVMNNGRSEFLRKDEVAADRLLNEEFGESYRQLEEAQINALDFYRLDGYADMNALLRNIPVSLLNRITRSPMYDDILRGRIADLDKAFTHELSEDTEVWRGVSESAIGNDPKPGMFVTDPGYTSTSLLKHVARSFKDATEIEYGKDAVLCRIVAKRGTPCTCTYKPSGSYISLEGEILLPRGQKFVVTEVSNMPGGERIIHMETV